MKHLLLFAIVGAGLIASTTAFASTSNFISMNVMNLGASDDKAILTDISAIKVDFSICQNYNGVTHTNLANAPDQCKASGTTVPPLFGITDCDITDSAADTIPIGEVIFCKLTGLGADHISNNLLVAEGTYQVKGTPATEGGALDATGKNLVCSTATPCHFKVDITSPDIWIDVQKVGDVKVIAKGLAATPPNPISPPIG